MRQRQYEGCTWRILAYRILRKALKRISKKRKRWYFASGSARKPPFFSVFKLVNLVSKSDDTLTARRSARIVKVSSYTRLCQFYFFVGIRWG